MNYYKFGNKLCELREAHGMTQRELAELADVSDKAVSKWENGQAIPRMETLEKIADILNTSVEELIIISKDSIKHILIENQSGLAIHMKIDDQIISLGNNDKKWIYLDVEKNTHEITAYGELKLGEMIEDTEEAVSLKEKISSFIMKKAVKLVDKFIAGQVIYTKCSYKVSNINDGQSMIINSEIIDIGDRMFISNDIFISFLRLEGNFISTLKNAQCINKPELMSSFKKAALTSELGISIPFMLLAYPFRKAYFKKLLRSKSLMKFILNADRYIEKEENLSKKKTKHPIIKAVCSFLLVLLLIFVVDIVIDIINVANERPYLISADYSKIDYRRMCYIRIDDLPKGAYQKEVLGAEVWEDARVDGESKFDQSCCDHKVTEFVDDDGNTYLWLVPDYIENIIDENGEFKEYDDFEKHYVYKLKE